VEGGKKVGVKQFEGSLLSRLVSCSAKPHKGTSYDRFGGAASFFLFHVTHISWVWRLTSTSARLQRGAYAFEISFDGSRMGKKEILLTSIFLPEFCTRFVAIPQVDAASKSACIGWLQWQQTKKVLKVSCKLAWCNSFLSVW
jgi:hypothetical protein